MDGWDTREIRSRNLPLPALVEVMKQRTGREDIEEGKLRFTLYDTFRDESNPKTKKYMRVLLEAMEAEDEDNEQFLGGMRDTLRQKLEDCDDDYMTPARECSVECRRDAFAGCKREIPEGEILLTGCQTDQTSMDANPSENEAFGAFTNALAAVIAETEGEVTNYDLIAMVRERLSGEGVPQEPGLYCCDSLVSDRFIC